MILRRLYLYLVSAAGLALLAAGLVLLGTTVLLFVFNDPSAQDSRTQLAIYTAMTLVALPVWGVHFWFARRFAMRDPYERASAIRRLYLYWACLGAAIGSLIGLAMTAGDLLRPLIDACGFTGYAPLAKGGVPVVISSCPASQNWLATSQAGWVAIAFLAIWAFHFRIAARDRAAVGEAGASATLRRWYFYVVLLVGLLVMLNGASSLIQDVWLKAVNSPLGNGLYLGDAASMLIAGGLVWGFHARTIAQSLVADDRHSTLRALEGFIAVAVTIAVALVGASLILYYVLARALGVQHPGGAGTDILGDLASPASQVLVYGSAWFLMRRRLAKDAATQEADRQAGIRRLYTNLVALVSLAAWAIGAGSLLWTLADQAEAPIIGVSTSDWRDPVSLWITLLVVGVVVWLAHWRQAPWAADRQSLPRRLYVWGALLASVLVILGAGVGMLAAVLRQVFSAHPTLADSANLDFGHYLAVIIVAAGVGFYHWRVLRADSAARPPKVVAVHAPTAEVVPAAVPLGVKESPGHVPEPQVVDPNTRRYVLTVTGATEDDVHQALAGLPPQAAYKLIHAESGSDASLTEDEAQRLLDLVDWRRRVGDLYRTTGADALEHFRQGRDHLFRTHPQSPIEPEERNSFAGLRYFPGDPVYRVGARFEPAEGSELLIDTGGEDGAVRYRRAGHLVFQLHGEPCRLTVLSLVQYAGGLFVPFRDATSGRETYGGGRYLFDTAKDTDGLVLEITPGSSDVTIDFNYAYNASCAYSPLWACPLAPPENYLTVPVRAGELSYKT